MDAGELARLLAALEAGELRARKAAQVLAGVPPGEAVALLGELIRRADRRSDPEAAALEGLLRAVRELLDEERLDLLYRAAEATADLEVQALLARTEPARSFDHEKEEWVDREMRARTLGERRALAEFKLRRAAATAELVRRRGWRFVKWGPLRSWATQPDVALDLLEPVLGLSPEVEQTGQQLAFRW